MSSRLFSFADEEGKQYKFYEHTLAETRMANAYLEHRHASAADHIAILSMKLPRL